MLFTALLLATYIRFWILNGLADVIFLLSLTIADLVYATQAKPLLHYEVVIILLLHFEKWNLKVKVYKMILQAS